MVLGLIATLAVACGGAGPATSKLTDDARAYMSSEFVDSSWYGNITGYRAEGSTLVVMTNLSDSALGTQAAQGICTALTFGDVDAQAVRVNGQGDVVLVSSHGPDSPCEER